MRQVPIDQVVRDGRAFDPKWRGPVDDIRERVHELFTRLQTAEVDYLLVGGVAMLAYVEGRNTKDIDLIVSPRAAESLPVGAELRDESFGKASFGELDIDLLLTSNPLFAHVQEHHATAIEFGEHQVPCATPEGLILLKLYALPSLYRQERLDRAALYETDILMLRRAADFEGEEHEARWLERLSDHLRPADVAELGRILAEQRRPRRF